MIIIINGKPGSGKDSVVNFVAREVASRKNREVHNYSTVDDFRAILHKAGIWKKDETFRRCLSELKETLHKHYIGYTVKRLKKKFNTKKHIVFVHCREEEEIEKIKQAYPYALAVYVKRKGNTFSVTNSSDDVDYESPLVDVLLEAETLKELKQVSKTFCKNFIEEA